MASEDVRFVFCISFCVVQLGKAVAVEGDWKWGPPVGRSPSGGGRRLKVGATSGTVPQKLKLCC